MKSFRLLIAGASLLAGTQLATMGCFGSAGDDCNCPNPDQKLLFGTYDVTSVDVDALDAGVDEELAAVETGVVAVTSEHVTISYQYAGSDKEIAYQIVRGN